MAVYESKLPMAVAHDGFTLAFFLAGRGGGGEERRGEKWRGTDGTGSTGVLDGPLHGELNRGAG
jgi:hypothetical protein